MAPRILELIGLPCAGKSTLAAALAARLAVDLEVYLPDLFDHRRKELTLIQKLRLDAMSVACCLRYRGGIGVRHSFNLSDEEVAQRWSETVLGNSSAT